LTTPPAASASTPASEEGGKAAGLRRCEALGLAVPPFFVVPASAFRQHLSRGSIPSLVGRLSLDLDDLPSAPDRRAEVLAEASKALMTAIVDEPVDERVRRLIVDGLARLGSGPWSVRSSMVGEDSARHSFAGQLDTFLYQTDLESVVDSVRRCWASTFSERVLAYAVRVGALPTRARSAVVVQDMVEADVAGVAFTINPITGRRGECLITAGYGAGEGIVSGRVDTDEYVWSKVDGEREVRLAQKTLKLGPNPDGGTSEYAVDERDSGRRALSESQLREVATVSLAIAEDMGVPADVEWCLRGDKIYVLQARPVTAAVSPDDPTARHLVFDNSNIQESFTGVTTPLTFSFASTAYERVFSDFARAFGVSGPEMEGFAASARTLLAFVHGRVYYNLMSWYAMIGLFPGSDVHKEATEKVMWHLGDSVEYDEKQHGQSLAERLRLLRVGVQMTFRILKVDLDIREFKARFDNFYETVDRAAIPDLGMTELHANLVKLNEEVRNRWEAPNINDFRVMLLCGALRRTCSAVSGDAAEATLADLLSNIEGIESLQPTKTLLDLAGELRGRPELRRALSVEPAAAAFTALCEASPDVERSLNGYLERYGDRCAGELKLETVTLREDPGFLIQILRSYVSDARGQRQLDDGRDDRFDKTMRSTAGALPRWRRPVFKLNVRGARRAVAAREELRLMRTRVFGVARDIYRAIGSRLHESGVLEHPDDIYYLTVDEIAAFQEGRAVTTDLAGLVGVRRAERQRNEEREAPNRVLSTGSPYLSVPLTAEPEDRASSEPGNVLKGLGCCAGVVEAPVRVIVSLDGQLPSPGEIICTVRTDPGWAPLFPSASGLIVERGSTLSHSAVVARELGLPTVVGVENATQLLDQGEVVRLDGQAGTIERHYEGRRATEAR
jgi:rifampicin phosphotransferase